MGGESKKKHMIDDNGVLREMTLEEVKAMKEERAEIPEPQPSPVERLTALETENAHLKQDNEDLWLALAQVELGGETL